MSSIEDLPPEMICELFKHLKPRDLATCSMVNKRWRSIYSNFKIHRLAVFDFYSVDLFYTPFQKYDANFAKWSNPDRLVEDQELCQQEVFRCLIDQPLLSNLQHLSLSGYWLDLNKLSGLFTGSGQLMHLELNVWTFSRTELQLKLPKLRVLAVHQLKPCISLSVDCPELSVLLYLESTSENVLEVKHPETIRTLETNMFGEKLDPFKNVERLITRNAALEAVSRRTLLSLPKLKELHHNESIRKIVRIPEISSIDQMKQWLLEFLADMQELKGADFKFRFAGFQMSEAMLGQIDLDMEEFFDEWVYMDNYQLIEPNGALGFIRTVDYSCLLSVAGGELPSCFSKKFTGIQIVTTNDKIEDVNHFLRFLRSLSLLRSLTLNGSGLVQEFYDQLPATARSLTTLCLNEPILDQKEQQMSFGFINQFLRLTRFTIQNKICFETFESCLVSCLGKFKEGCFQFLFWGEKGRYNNSISKNECSQSYELSKEIRTINETHLKTKNPDEILNHFRDRFEF